MCRQCKRLAWVKSRAKPVTSKQVADHFGVAHRTARRWLLSWEQAGEILAVALGTRSTRWKAKP